MILIGQYDSPFVRRIGIALTLYGMTFEHRPWSSFGDAGKLSAYNPLMRVPTLVLDDGDVLVESHAMVDYLDGLVPAEQRLLPIEEPARHRALKVVTLATGLADKAVGLFYEKRLHKQTSDAFVARWRLQILGVVQALEADRAGRTTPFWLGERIGHADIAVTAAMRFLNDAHPGLVAMTEFPALAAHCTRLEAMPVFQSISQPFVAPA